MVYDRFCGFDDLFGSDDAFMRVHDVCVGLPIFFGSDDAFMWINDGFCEIDDAFIEMYIMSF